MVSSESQRNLQDRGRRSYGTAADSASHSPVDPDIDNIPPPDRGRDAWFFLAGCFVLEGLLWGLPFSYGVFESYYTTHEPFSSAPDGVAAVGTTMTGLIYFMTPFIIVFLQRNPRSRFPISIAGFALIVISLTAASFASRTGELVVTQGAMYGIGGALLYNPFILYTDEWFVARKGFAFGVMWAGTGLGGTLVPVVLHWALEKYGFRTTLRVWGGALFVLIAPLIALVRPRLPPPSSRDSCIRRRRKPLALLLLRVLRTWPFWIFQLGNVIESLGYFMPAIYLPSFASEQLFLPTLPSALLVSTLNISALVGTIVIGSLTDVLDPSSVILISTLGSTTATFIFWGFGVNVPVLFLYALLYGFFAGAYPATWTGCVREIQRDVGELDATVLIGIMAAGRGVGAVASGPLSEFLLRFQRWDNTGLKGAYGTEYGLLIAFTGATALLGGLGGFVRLRKRRE